MKKKLQLKNIKVTSFQTEASSVNTKTVKGGNPSVNNTNGDICTILCTEYTFCDAYCFTNQYEICIPDHI